MDLDDSEAPPECFEIIIETDDDDDALILRRYWAASLGETGRPEFHEHVKHIADDLGMQAAEVSALARRSGFALEAGMVCPSCEEPWPRRTRSDRPQRWDRCERCKAAQQQAHAAAVAATEAEQSDRQAVLDAHLSQGILEGPGISIVGEMAEAWDLADVVDLLTWLLATGPNGILVAVERHDVALFATLDAVESRLWKLGVLGIDPSTDMGAFVWDDPSEDALPPFYAHRARFYVRGEGPLRDRVEDAIGELRRVLSAPWPMQWVDQCASLASRVLAGEARRYLEYSIEDHGLPILDRDQAEQFRRVAEDALTTYSLGQCYSFLWRAAKDGAAATKRHPMPLSSGTSHAVNQFERGVSWARQDKWEVKQYRSIRDLPFTWQTQVLFTQVLGLEPMTALVREVKAIARDRLGDDDTVQRLLAEGIPDKRAKEALDRLRATPRFGDAIDSLVDAVKATAESVLESGGSSSDALRAAYFGVEMLRHLSLWSDYELDEAKQAVATAVRG